jgi:hypothetical protein
MYGLTQTENLDNLSECFYDADQFIYDIDHAWAMIASRSFAGLMNGFILLLSTVAYVPVDLRDCYNSKEDVAALEQWASIFTTPADLSSIVEYNLKHHLPALTLDLNKARSDYVSGDYVGFGEVLG